VAAEDTSLSPQQNSSC